MLSTLLHLIFPNCCLACGGALNHQLKNICLMCRNNLPRYRGNKQKEDQLNKLFWGRLQLERIAAAFYFEKAGLIQELIHQLKYEGKKELGISLGELSASDLIATAFFKGIDYLIPVPIHPNKKKIRGYNQSLYIAEGVHNISGIPLEEKLITKQVHTDSQTKKGRFQRWQNVSSSFHLNEQMTMEGKHLLLIDDVLTTGSTIEACAMELKKIKQVKISLLVMAYTY